MNTVKTRLNSRQVRAAFKREWATHLVRVPADKNDKPKKRMAFSFFVDDLQRSGEISDRVAQNATL